MGHFQKAGVGLLLVGALFAASCSSDDDGDTTETSAASSDPATSEPSGSDSPTDSTPPATNGAGGDETDPAEQLIIDSGYGYPTAGSDEALANADCDPETGNIRVPWIWAPPCVKAFPEGADNGGETAQGVTADTIKVIYLEPNAYADEASERGSYLAAKDAVEIYNRFWETYGRTVDLINVQASGPDETAQRADAIKIAEMEPFAVITNLATGGSVLEGELAKRGVVTLGWVLDREDAEAQAPFRYGTNIDFDSGIVNVTEFIGGALVGETAKWAGDEAMQEQERKFGFVFPDTLDRDLLEERIEANGIPAVIADYTFRPLGFQGDPATYEQEAQVIISRLKSEGVNNIVGFTDQVINGALQREATAQNYFPEWFITGFQYQDVDLFAWTNYDFEQWSHAFGIGASNIVEEDVITPAPHRFYYWYYPSDRQNIGFNGREFYLTGYLFAGLHMAGPNLTPDTLRAGMFNHPPVGGAACDCRAWPQMSFGDHGFVPWDDFVGWDDWVLVWFNPDATGISNNGLGQYGEGQGKHMYLNEAQRYVSGSWPSEEPPFFDESQSIASFDGVPPQDVVPDYPCEGCPSQG